MIKKYFEKEKISHFYLKFNKIKLKNEHPCFKLKIFYKMDHLKLYTTKYISIQLMPTIVYKQQNMFN